LDDELTTNQIIKIIDKIDRITNQLYLKIENLNELKNI
jgi:hypothetical protein